MARTIAPSVLPTSAESFEEHFTVLKDIGRGRFGEVQLVEEKTADKGSSSSSSSSNGGVEGGNGGACSGASSAGDAADCSSGAEGSSSGSLSLRRYAIKRTAFGSSGQPDRQKVEVEAAALGGLV